MPWVVPVIAIASAGISAYQGIKAGKSAKKAGLIEQQAAIEAGKLYDWNANVAALQAQDAIDRGRYEEERYREQVSQAMGSARSIQAAQGIDVNYGSAVDVQADIAKLGEMDALMIRTNAMREAWGYKVEGVDQKMRGIIARESGVHAAAAGAEGAKAAYWSVGGNLLGTGASLLYAKYGFKKTQVPYGGDAATTEAWMHH